MFPWQINITVRFNEVTKENWIDKWSDKRIYIRYGVYLHYEGVYILNKAIDYLSSIYIT